MTVRDLLTALQAFPRYAELLALEAGCAVPVAHYPFGVMLAWPPLGTMGATTPDGKRMG